MAATKVNIFFSTFCYIIISVKMSDMKDREYKLREEILNLLETNKTFAEEYNKAFGDQSEEFGSTRVRKSVRTFPCPRLPRSNPRPTSVHKLRPADFDVVAAMGDSYTAARGAKLATFGLLMDFRGVSWCIGGDDDYSKCLTIPNILRQFNGNLYGFSKGVLPTLSNEKFNVAVTGAKAWELLGQARKLVDRMRSDSKVNMSTDWKLITILIGGNDLCDYCEDMNKYSAANYKDHLQKTLDYLFENVPRAFVNLVAVMRVEFVVDMGKSWFCRAIHSWVCDCAANGKSPEKQATLIRLRESYQQAARDLASSGRYDKRDDFTVVLQPFYTNVSIPSKSQDEIDLSYFAADCFHLSKKGNELAATALWNNMLEPVGNKSNSWVIEGSIKCPTEARPYVYTAKNSGNQTTG